jgi:hypothetical protein
MKMQTHTAERQMSLEDFVLSVECARRSAERGEYLRGHSYLSKAVDHLLGLLADYADSNDASRPLAALSRRRLETRNPTLAREILAVLLGEVYAPELRLLEICERRLRPLADDLCWSEFEQMVGSFSASERSELSGLDGCAEGHAEHA